MQPTNLQSEYVKETTTTMILNVRWNVDSEKSESQMGFEPTTLRDLVGCSNHRATRDSMVSKGYFVRYFVFINHLCSTLWPCSLAHDGPAATIYLKVLSLRIPLVWEGNAIGRFAGFRGSNLEVPHRFNRFNINTHIHCTFNYSKNENERSHVLHTWPDVTGNAKLSVTPLN